ncbi:MAG: copper amine oxidase N-terminal domain-containing protein [Bacillota bacterium]|jgi:hypothetical protein
MLIATNLKNFLVKPLIVLIFLTYILSGVQINGAKADRIKVFIDEKEVIFDVLPRIENGRVLVPFRAIFEPLGGKVRWHAEQKMVIARFGLLDLRFRVGETTARLGNKNINLDVPAKIINGRTLIPLRFISENLFSAHVEWSNENKTVYISSAKEKDVEPITKAFQSAIFEKKPGEIIDISHLNVIDVPEIIPERISHPQFPVTLLFSDSPEYVDQPGVTYRGKAQGDIRLVYYHIPRLNTASRMALVAHNPGNETALITVKRHVNGDKEPNRKMWQDLGTAVTLEYLNPKATQGNSTYSVPAGSSVLLSPNADDYLHGELMYGIADLYSDKTLEFSFVLLPKKDIKEVFAKAKNPVLPADGRHDRGTFPKGDQLLQVTLGNKLVGFLIGDGFSDPALLGKDESTGIDTNLLGNYGVNYHLMASFDAPVTVLLVPLGGDIFSGGIVTPDGLLSLLKVPTFSQALYVGDYQKGEEIEWDFMPPAGSSLPVLIIAVPR